MEVVSEIKTLSLVLVAWDGNGVKAGSNFLYNVYFCVEDVRVVFRSVMTKAGLCLGFGCGVK
jgi:hypothetical protein